MRSFDPVRLGGYETDAWVAYYRRRWAAALVAFVGMVRVGFGMPWPRTLHGAWLVLRANQAWAPYPDNDPDAARSCMRRFYALVVATHHESFDVNEAPGWRSSGGGSTATCSGSQPTATSHR